MIYGALIIGIGWLLFAAIATLAMLTTVALNSGMAEMKRVIVAEMPLMLGLASPGLVLVLIALLSLALAGRRPENRR